MMKPEKSNPLYIITPTLDCPAKCTYCFMPHHSAMMSFDILAKSLEYIKSSNDITGNRHANILFHGGEPLLAPYPFWEHAFMEMDKHFPLSLRKTGMQSNLWLLDHKLARLFQKNNLTIGTSIDGPKDICDRQRGEGYFDKTLKGINLARDYGILSGGIASLTAQQLHRWPEVFDFFLEMDLSFLIRPIVPSQFDGKGKYAVPPDKWGEILVEMFEAYIKLAPRIQIGSLDQVCKSAFYRHGDVCTFTECFGNFTSISPNGDLYPCHRACGNVKYRLGNVQTSPPGPALYDTGIAQELQSRITRSLNSCEQSSCTHFEYCRSGCYYNMLQAGENAARDPYCSAYKKAFTWVRNKLIDEISCAENMEAIRLSPPQKKENPLYRKGPLIDIAKDRPHPLKTTRTYQSIVTAYALARIPAIDEAAAFLFRQGLAKTEKIAKTQIIRFKSKLFREKPLAVNDIFLHITYRCPNNCRHCYADAGAGKNVSEMPADLIIKIIKEADRLGSNLTITGGEPMAHNRFEELTDQIIELRESNEIKRSLFLSTSLSMPVDGAMAQKITAAFNTIGVSIDGEESVHDERRGTGSYRQAIENIRKLACENAHIRIGHTVGNCSYTEQRNTISTVEAIAEELGGYEVTALPMLPLGRAGSVGLQPVSKNLPEFKSSREIVRDGFTPKRRCLAGKLHIDPNGDLFPCYACRWPDAKMGNISDGLHSLLSGKKYADLAECTVDSNPKCKSCDYRYLCGGACLAWQQNSPGSNYNLPAPDCSALRLKAAELYELAAGELQALVKNEQA